MKLVFEEPQITVQHFTVEDILTASGSDDSGCNYVDFIPV